MRPSSPTRQPPAATTEADDRIDPHVRGLTAEGGSLAGAGPGATKPRKDLVDLLVQQAHERAGLHLPSGAADPASSDEDTAMPRVPADAARPASSRSPADARASAQRLERLGAEVLGSHELLALLIGPHTACGAPQLANDLLEAYGSLRGLSRAPAVELVRRHGLGRVAARRVVAALGLARRAASEALVRGARLATSQQIFEAYHLLLRDLAKERFLTVLVDGKNRVIGEVVVSEGILTASLVHPREVFTPALRAAAAGMVLVHNHPSGDPDPSPEDHEVTRRLVAVGDLVGIRVLDHVVIGDGRYVSFLERGWLPS